MKSMSLHMKSHFKELRDEIGINVCALKLIQKDVNDHRNFADETGGLDFNKPSFDF